MISRSKVFVQSAVKLLSLHYLNQFGLHVLVVVTVAK